MSVATKTIQIPSIEIQCKAKVSKLNKDDRTVTFSALDESWIERYDWWAGERYLLKFDLAGMDLSRVGNGVAMFTDDHSDDRRIGKLIAASIDNGALNLTARVGTSEWGTRYLQEVADEVEPGKSIEATILELETIEEATYDGKGWDAKLISPAKLVARVSQLTAVSTVSTPAVGTVGFRDQPTFAVQLSGNPRLPKLNAMTDQQNSDRNSDPQLQEIVAKLEKSVDALTEKFNNEQTARQQAEQDRDTAQRQLALSTDWQELRSKAESLMLAKKLPKHEFDEIFSGDAASVKALLTTKEPQVELAVISRRVTAAESRTPAKLPTKLQAPEPPASTQDLKDETDSANDRTQRYRDRRSGKSRGRRVG
jgi:hypothetical protein